MSFPAGVATDWQRYLGLWYEQARIPSWFETKNDGNVTATYTKPTNSSALEIVNRSVNTKTGREKVARGSAHLSTDRPGVLRVKFSFFAPRSDYIVLAHGTDYEWALVGTRNRKRLWLLTRSAAVTPEFVQQTLAIAKGLGYSDNVLAKLQRTPRTERA